MKIFASTFTGFCQCRVSSGLYLRQNVDLLAELSISVCPTFY